MKKRGKLLAFLLAFCMATSNFLWCGEIKNKVFAEELEDVPAESFTVDDVVYREIEQGKVQLVEWQKTIQIGEEIEIPRTVTYDGEEYVVVSIGDSAFYKNTNRYWMKKVTFPDTIESIGQAAFEYCGGKNPLELTLPPNLKEIGNDAFWNSYISGELVIPDSVTSIGTQAFRETQISSVVITNPNIVYGTQVFAYNKKLTSIQLPDGMTSLGEGHFLWGCSSLENINMPESITSIPNSALNGCTSLTEIHIPDSVNQIGSSAFCGCTGVTEIVVPEGVTEILIWTFRNCGTNLCVTLPDSITSVHNSAFWDTKAEKETYSVSTTVKCTSREVAALVAGIGHKNILLNGDTYELDEFTAEGFQYIVTDKENQIVQLNQWAGTRPSGEVTIPEKVTWEGKEYTVTTIGENAFWACVDVTKIELPNTITGIGTRAFWNCTNLTSINLPDGITRIEQMTFNNCPLLTDLTLPSNLQYIGPYAFDGCAGLQEIEIPGSCTQIDTGVFYHCTGITKVTLCEGMTKIGNNMFCGCTGIKEIQIPDSVQKIDDCAFQNCTELEKITLNQSLTEIGQIVFNGCDKLTGNIVLPDSVTTIRQDAFVGSSFSIIQVGDGLTTLESNAFPDSIRLTTYSPTVYNLLVKNTNRTGENAPVLLWNGKSDIPAGMSAYVEEDIVITDNVAVKEGALVTVLSGASITVEENAALTIEETGRLAISADALVTINGALTNNGTVNGAGELTVNGTVSGTGSFAEGMNFTLPLTEAMVANVPDVVYSITPASPEPEVSVSFGADKIVFEKDTDFTYSYANNTKPGQASITVTPKTGGKLTGNPVTKPFTISKATQAAPEECILTFEKNEDGKTFTAVIAKTEGAEYSFDGEIWSEENKKNDCLPETEYTAFIRMKETEFYFASPSAQNTLTAPKIAAEPPKDLTEKEPTEDVKELAAPEIKSITAQAGKTGVSVQIEVTPVANADRYEIYRIAGTNVTLVAATESGKSMIQDENPIQSAKYYAVAVSKDGKVKSPAGSQKEITFSKGTKIKKVSSSSVGVKITWKKAKNAKKYVLYRSTKKNSGYVKVKALGKKKVSFLDKKAKKGKSYYYKIVVLTKSQPSLMSKASKKVKR